MNMAITGESADNRFDCQSIAPAWPVPDLRADLLHGFAQRPRCLPPKYFYDAVGSQLFERICATPEYYPARVEAALLADEAESLMARVRPDHLIELGSGSARKTRYLLRAAEELELGLSYWPFDVCRDMLEQAGRALIREFPALRVRALVGDYLAGLAHLPQPPGRRLFAFLGGTIGNFSEAEAQWFLDDLRACMQPDDCLLLGADRIKPVAVLEAAYDDAAGVTAAFNLNLLRVINRELGADFDLSAFRHRAVFNVELSRIEMYLSAQTPQQVSVLESSYWFAAGEAILTEISRKFSDAALLATLARAGFEVERHLENQELPYSLVLARPT